MRKKRLIPKAKSERIFLNHKYFTQFKCLLKVYICELQNEFLFPRKLIGTFALGSHNWYIPTRESISPGTLMICKQISSRAFSY